MNIFTKYFSTNKNSNVTTEKTINYEASSPEHIDFANEAVEILNPVLRKFGFNLLKVNITEYRTTIVWIKNKNYIELGGNTHPHDAPSFFGIILGEFKEDNYHYADLDCVGLWRLKAIQENLDKVNDTPFPFGANIKPSLIQIKDDLLKYGKSFLEGDMLDFYNARNKQWNQ
jgi:hypothetical protein